MVKLQVIYKKDGNKKRVIQLDTATVISRSADAPAFVEVEKEKNKITFIFPGSKEKKTIVKNNNGASISLGNISGRIYCIEGISTESDINSITEAIKTAGIGNSSRRFIENTKSFMTIANKILGK